MRAVLAWWPVAVLSIVAVVLVAYAVRSVGRDLDNFYDDDDD